jgi:2-polyprenyl-6-methoxyphenol hydroxylase-like FAD-dependent oxidoreductase
VTDQTAVVLGGSIAGLLAAAALAETFSAVTVVERDILPIKPIGHLHSVLSRGWITIESLVPGVLADLVAAGVEVLDDVRLGTRIHLRNGPYAFNHTDPVAEPAALVTYLATRPLLEFVLRQRVKAISNVTIIDGHDVGELIAAQPHRITGVTVCDRRAGTIHRLSADLVVDATGRATRTPLLLEQQGFQAPPQQSFTVHGVYYSQQIAIPEQDTFPERLILVVPPGNVGRGGLIAGENNTWTLTVAKRATYKHSAPTTFADMLALAEEFVPAHLHPALRRAQPLTEVTTYRYPGGTWYRYDRQPHLPGGLVVVGDALCSLDPINGQGITLTALQICHFRKHLRMSKMVDPQQLHQQLATTIAPVWAANQPPGSRRPRNARHALQLRTIRWSRTMILQAAGDIVVTERLMRVANMVDPPQRLFEPAVLTRVAAHHLRRVRAHA